MTGVIEYDKKQWASENANWKSGQARIYVDKFKPFDLGTIQLTI